MFSHATSNDVKLRPVTPSFLQIIVARGYRFFQKHESSCFDKEVLRFYEPP